MSLAALPKNDMPHLRGDFNGDGRVNSTDYVTWRRNRGTASEAAINFNGDGINGVDVGDYPLWRQNFGLFSVPTGQSADLDGDFNGDGAVDAADFAVWRRNLGAATESSLSFAGDGLNGVDMGDYLLWRRNFGTTSDAVEGINPTVPEPPSMLLLMLACNAFLGRRFLLILEP